MTVKLLTEHHLEFLSFKGGFKGLSESTFVKMSESTLVKMSHCWKSHVTVHMSSGRPISRILHSRVTFDQLHQL